MTDLTTLTDHLDRVDSGLPATPDLEAIRSGGRRLRRRRRSARALGAVAAVTVLGVVAVPALRPPLPFTAPGSLFASGSDGTYVTLQDPGWQVTHASQGDGETDVTYAHGDAEIEIVSYPASEYDSYVADRSELGGARTVQVLGQDATQWTYAPDDHTVIRTAQDGRFAEIRGTGLTEAEFEAELRSLTLADETSFADSMPSRVVTPARLEGFVQATLAGIDLPPGFTAADVHVSGVNDRYQAGAQVVGAVGCAWIDLFDTGTPAAQRQAIDAFAASRHWPVLTGMTAQGAYPQVFWSMADRLRALADSGRSAASLKQGLC